MYIVLVAIRMSPMADDRLTVRLAIPHATRLFMRHTRSTYRVLYNVRSPLAC
jgi:hypothetical protein